MAVIAEGAASIALVFAILLTSAESAAQELFGAAQFGGGPSTLYEIDPTSGAATLVGPVGFDRISGMDFGPDGTLYATAQRPGSNVPVLIAIDTTTGVGTEIGPTGITGAVADLSFREDGTLFAYDAAASDHTLYTLSLTTGAASLVGSTGLSFDGGNGVAFDQSGTLLHSNRSATHVLDQSNGFASFQSPFFGVAGGADDGEKIAAADLDPITGQIFGVCKSCGFDTLLVTTDYASGVAMQIGSTQPGLDALAFAGAVTPVDVDIKPGSDPNSINPSSRGVIPVAILGSDEFDVADVDATTLAFGPAAAAPVDEEGGAFEDANGDGLTDLVSHYRTPETGIEDGETKACVRGLTHDEEAFSGCDVVRTVPSPGPMGGRPSTTLYGVTGDGANVPESLFTLSLTDAMITFVGSLGNGNDGETIAFNPDDGLLYHASGLGTANISEIFESIDPSNCCVPTPIILSGDDYSEATALTYAGGGVFLLADLGGRLFEVTSNGVVSFVGPLNDTSKGLAFSGGVLYSVSRSGDQLREIDPVDGSTLSSVTLDLVSGQPIFGANGLATDPGTGELYALLRLPTGRELAVVEPGSGIATSVGDTGDGFAGLAFVSGRGRPRSCGMGMELALLLPPLLWLHRRRGRRMA